MPASRRWAINGCGFFGGRIDNFPCCRKLVAGHCPDCRRERCGFRGGAQLIVLGEKDSVFLWSGVVVKDEGAVLIGQTTKSRQTKGQGHLIYKDITFAYEPQHFILCLNSP